MVKKILTKYLRLLLFSATLIIGLCTYKSYGISWDEGSQTDLGQTTFNYLFRGDSALKHFQNRTYGVGFELPLVVLAKVLAIHDSRDFFLMRHIVSHLFFLLGALAFFLLIDYIYKNKLLATIGFLLLVVNPLIYGHSFFNTKDVPFMAMFNVCFLLTAIAFKENKLKWYLLLGIACGLLTNMRIMGMLLIGCIGLFFIIDLLMPERDRELKKKTIFNLFVFGFTSFLVLYITWPYLYTNPIGNLVTAFTSMAKYNWNGDVLFYGTLYPSTNLPWYYAISWFCISNPIIYLAMGFFGIAYFIIKFFKTPKSFIFENELRIQALFVFCFIEPLLAVVILHSVLYDAWRQLYFIYPAFILAGLYGLNYLIKTKAKLPALLLIFSSIGYTGVYMVSNFPLQHVYFNTLVKRDEPEYLRKNFEMDYWGTSCKQGIDYILKNDTSQNINIAVSSLWVGMENKWLLKPDDRKRVNFISDMSKANYFISFYRTHPQDYPFQQREIYSIKILNSTVISVFKLN